MGWSEIPWRTPPSMLKMQGLALVDQINHDILRLQDCTRRRICSGW